MSDERIRVAVRVRPLSAHEVAAGVGCVLATAGGSTLQLADPIAVEMAAAAAEQQQHVPGSMRFHTRDFSFDRIYTSASQKDIYDDIGRAVLDSAFAGINACVLAYGQTGR